MIPASRPQLQHYAVERLEPQVEFNKAFFSYLFFSGRWRRLHWSAGILHGSLSHNASGGDGPQSQSGGGSECAGCWHADVLPLQEGPAS